MHVTRLARGVAALGALAALAAVLFFAVQSALLAAGVPESTAYPTAVGAVLPPVLAVADAYTPFGNTERTDALRSVPAAKLAVDGVLAAAVGAVGGYVGGTLFLSSSATSLAELVVVTTAVVAGYVTFIARNIDVYGDRNSGALGAEDLEP
ncbi:MAG: hypothetical protein ABEH83_04220 [Halobacterium sp.]